ncbi:hypothetical protein O159_22810 [Leifsonia xyli subsp. cynodontis DSM 46306]|uniref:Uncharacterized protein n=1 Tax=Leifsonia xyli subsp. cynodontis DSM 46306 TaxID=1389489 RepID=U3P7A9_LEIXC|nr:hypothetical protein [Leifsonia xyli]AGW41721.1 hypothetical protein O159_16760 [Leifsonia xyli subsp. cynodontis DSM 46306]AGW42244.1 hypothetical protein O159_22810 [Leifsonia xyli subsp. cynodontis DSM 46306]
MSPDTIPVLIDITGNEIHILELINTPVGLALNDRGVYSLLGTVREAQIAGAREGSLINSWRWDSEGYSGEAKTKAAAIAAMLTDTGYVQATLTDTIPDLLDHWDGAG